ncbi:MAG: hypothetical protein JWQ26_755 [Modestobacter sp.]|nr:hypothetical protein [Modestobacter sp.]
MASSVSRSESTESLAAELRATAEREALEYGRWLLGDRRAAA